MEKSIKQYSKTNCHQLRVINETGFYSVVHSKRMVMLKEGAVLPLVSVDGDQCHLYADRSGWGNKVRGVVKIHASKVTDIDEILPDV